MSKSDSVPALVREAMSPGIYYNRYELADRLSVSESAVGTALAAMVAFGIAETGEPRKTLGYARAVATYRLKEVKEPTETDLKARIAETEARLEQLKIERDNAPYMQVTLSFKQWERLNGYADDDYNGGLAALVSELDKVLL